MKKILSGMMGVVLAALTLVSCSKDEASSSSDLLAQIPADADFVIVGDMSAVAESADVELTTDGVSSLPAYITDQIPADGMLKEFNEAINKLGIDVTSAALFYKESLDVPVTVVRVKDSSALASFLKSDSFVESSSDGFKVYTKTDEYDWCTHVYCVVVNGNYAYTYLDGVYCSEGSDPKRDMIKVVKSVASGNFASTPAGEYIAKGNAGGMAVVCSEKTAKYMRREFRLSADLVRDIAGAFLGMRFDLQGSELKLTAQVLDKNGERFDFSKYAGAAFTSSDATISQKAVEYLAPETCALAALTFGGVDWNAVIDQVAEMNGGMSTEEETVMRMVAAYLKSLEGTVTIGVGVKDGLYSIARLANDRNRRPFDDLVVSAVVQTKPGKAQGLFREMASLVAASGMPYNVTDNGISIDVTDLGATLYVSAFDDMLTVSTVPVSGRSKNAVSKSIDFGSYNAACAVVCGKGSQIMEQLDVNIGLQLLAASNPENGEFTLALKSLGTSDPLLKALIKAGFDISGNIYRLLPIFEGVSSSVDYFNDYDYDEVAADSVLYDAEAWEWED